MIAENQYDFKPGQLNETTEDAEGLNALVIKKLFLKKKFPNRISNGQSVSIIVWSTEPII